MQLKHPFSRHDYIFLLVLGALYYVLIRQYVNPMEDVMFAYVRTFEGHQWDQPIRTLSDVFQSAGVYYFVENGRELINNTCVPFLLGMSWGLEAYFVICTLLFMALMAGMIALHRRLFGGNGYDKYILLFLFLLLIPSPGRTILGHVDFTANYLWPSAAMVWVLWYFFRIKDVEGRFPWWKDVLLFIGAFIVGSFHEGFSIPISGFFFFYYLFHLKKLRGPVIMLVVGFCLGTCATMLAPANFHRIQNPDYADLEGMGIKKWISTAIGMLRSQGLVQLYVFVLAVIVIWRNKFKIILTDNVYALVIGGLSIAFAVLIAFVGVHQLTPLAVMLTLLTASVIFEIIPGFLRKFGKPIAVVISLLLMVSYGLVYQYRSQWVQAWEALNKDASEPRKDYANAHAMWQQDRVIEGKILKEFVPYASCMMHMQQKHFFEQLTAIIATEGKNPDKLKCILPDSKEHIVEACSEVNKQSENLYLYDGYYIIKVPEGQKVTFNYQMKPSWIGGILQKQGWKQPQTMQLGVSTDAHCFVEDGQLYSLMYVEPKVVAKCWVE